MPPSIYFETRSALHYEMVGSMIYLEYIATPSVYIGSSLKVQQKLMSYVLKPVLKSLFQLKLYYPICQDPLHQTSIAFCILCLHNLT